MLDTVGAVGAMRHAIIGSRHITQAARALTEPPPHRVTPSPLDLWRGEGGQ